MEGFARGLIERHPSLTEFIDLAEADVQAALLTAAGLRAVNEPVLRAPTLGA